MNKIGFTGTRAGLTPEQRKSLYDYLCGYHPWDTEFVHGDCVGADAEAHGIATELGLVTVAYPSYHDDVRAFCAATIVKERNPPKARDILIVVHTDFLIACPRGRDEELRSGTWFTIRQAKKHGKKIFMIYPDGTSEVIPAGAVLDPPQIGD